MTVHGCWQEFAWPRIFYCMATMIKFLYLLSNKFLSIIQQQKSIRMESNWWYVDVVIVLGVGSVIVIILGVGIIVIVE